MATPPSTTKVITSMSYPSAMLDLTEQILEERRIAAIPQKSPMRAKLRIFALLTLIPENRAASAQLPMAYRRLPYTVRWRTKNMITARITYRRREKGILVPPMVPCPKNMKLSGYLVQACSPRTPFDIPRKIDCVARD